MSSGEGAVLAIPWDRVREVLNDDAEFRRAARYWDGSVRLGIGDAPFCLRLEQGRVEELRPWAVGDRSDVDITASEAEWERLLAPVPRPFYQSLAGAVMHHEVSLGGDVETSTVYTGALQRLLDVLRTHVTIE